MSTPTDAIAAMLAAPAANAGMDIIIVSTTTETQAIYWQRRLNATRGQIANRDALILAVHEDWPGGAGNGLGTLYAIQKAAALAQKIEGRDILCELRNGATIGLYHTAGKGTRMAPLPGSEHNNKPGVKLPGLLDIDGEPTPITILEAVIRQTATYAQARRGRLSTFWGDQVFIPTRAPGEPRHHADILCKLGPMPDPATWAAKGLDKYGLIAVDAADDASQVEKVSHAQASDLIARGVIAVEGGIGVSLGSFSISSALTEALLAEFADELAARQGKRDTDPHFWMPMTLDEDTYATVMASKGDDEATARAYHQRIAEFAAPFRPRLFGAVDIGADSYWWDYGQLRYYRANNLRLLDDDDEAAAMRQFFGIPGTTNGNVLLNSRVKGDIRNSLLVNVKADRLDIENCVLVAVDVPELHARDGIFYNVANSAAICANDGAVIAMTHYPGRPPIVMHTDIHRDGGKDWHEQLPGNALSYDALHRVNQDAGSH
jgi:hypothetical protein